MIGTNNHYIQHEGCCHEALWPVILVRTLVIMGLKFTVTCHLIRVSCNLIEWDFSNTDTLGTKIIVLISEVSIFQGENNMCPPLGPK